MFVIILAAILGPHPIDPLSTGHANAAKPGVQTMLPSSTRGAGVEQPFRYPDPYTSQAKEPAEPIATF